MNRNILIIITAIVFSLTLNAQEQLYSLDYCINFAIENSTQISRAKNSVSSEDTYLKQAEAARLPNLQLGVSQQFNSINNYNAGDSEWNRSNSNSINASLSSQVTLYNGAKLINTIRQNQINLNAAELNIQTVEELIGLNILSAYINVLLAKENTTNSQLQLETIEKQLVYAEAMKEAGSLSLSDLLNFKSQLASSKSTLIESESTQRIALVTLMQLMNMPISNGFDILNPDVDAILETPAETNPVTVYEIALGIQPNIKTAQLNVESSEKGIAIAKGDALPILNLGGGINTGYNSNLTGIDFSEQAGKGVNPYVGLNLTVPIFQRRQVKTQVKLAQIQVNNSELELTDMKNNLRKYIEQACTDAITAQSNYSAYEEQLTAEQEAYQVALEMINQGMMNSVDFLLSKNNLIESENKFTQAKYSMLLQNKIVEYYLGNPISL